MIETNEPFDAARYAPVLEALGVRHSTDADGDTYADWQDLRVWFLAAGERQEVLAMRMLWDHRAPAELFEAVVGVVNDWNSHKFWPRASVALRDDRVVVGADLVVDLETGATDAMITQQVRCMVGTSIELAEYLGEAYPQHAEWQRPGVR